MVYKYKKEIYPRLALIKAAYHYTDIAYVHLDSDEEYYYVSIVSKSGDDMELPEFDNEMLAQLARYEILQQTKGIRTISLARAMGSSVVGDEESIKEDTESISCSTEEILKDWFEA